MADKFQSLTPEGAHKLEEEAIEIYKGKIPRKARKTYTEPGIIHKVKSMFPFQLFPDELIITKEKVTLLNNVLPGMRVVLDLPIEDVAQVEADCGPVFAELYVYPRLRNQETLHITRLSRKEALAAQRIIESMIKKTTDQRGEMAY